MPVLGQRRDRHVGAIAAQLGYQSEAAFGRAFKRINGIPPATAHKRANTTTSTNALGRGTVSA
jgi:AraC-like DNA-binding protein